MWLNLLTVVWITYNRMLTTTWDSDFCLTLITLFLQRELWSCPSSPLWNWRMWRVTTKEWLRASMSPQTVERGRVWRSSSLIAAERDTSSTSCTTCTPFCRGSSYITPFMSSSRYCSTLSTGWCQFSYEINLAYQGTALKLQEFSPSASCVVPLETWNLWHCRLQIMKSHIEWSTKKQAKHVHMPKANHLQPNNVVSAPRGIDYYQ